MAKLGLGTKKRVARMRRQKKVLSKPQEKAVKAIAKKVSKQHEETKFFVYNGTLEPSTNSLTSYNLFYHGVSRGTGNNQFSGDQLNWRGIQVKYTVQNYYTDVTTQYNTHPFTIHMMIVRTPVYKTVTSLTAAELITDTDAYFGRGFLQNDVKMLFKKSVRYILPYSGTFNNVAATRRLLSGKIWLRRDQILKYVDFQQDYNLSKDNYYLVIYCESSVGGVQGHVDFSWQNYFKDS